MMRKLLFTVLCITCVSAIYAQGTVCVEIFNDVNANGVLDENESGIEGIMITVIAAPEGEGIMEPAITDAQGSYCFTDLDYGTYTFAVDVPEGWVFDGNPFFTVNITEENVNTGNSFRFAYADDPLSTSSFDQPLFSVYPNPASDVINVSGIQEGQLMIYDTLGKCVLTQSLTNSKVDVSSLAPGVYIANVVNGNQGKSVKFVVTR